VSAYVTAVCKIVVHNSAQNYSHNLPSSRRGVVYGGLCLWRSFSVTIFVSFCNSAKAVAAIVVIYFRMDGQWSLGDDAIKFARWQHPAMGAGLDLVCFVWKCSIQSMIINYCGLGVSAAGCRGQSPGQSPRTTMQRTRNNADRPDTTARDEIISLFPSGQPCFLTS